MFWLETSLEDGLMSLINSWRIEREKMVGGTKLFQTAIVQKYFTLAAALATVNVVVLLQRLIQ